MKSMNKKVVTIISVLALVILAGFWYLRENKVAKNKEIRSVGDIKEDYKPEEIDTSIWQTYKNDEYKYAFEYPSDWILTEYYKDVVPEPDSRLRGFRYVSFDTPDKVFNIEIGVKNQDESEWIFAHSWYTGIPAGNIFLGDKIKIGDGIVEKQILAYDSASTSDYIETKKYTPSKTLNTQLVFYCNPTQDKKITSCDDFQIGRSLVAHAEIHYLTQDYPVISQWTGVQEQTEKILKSLYFID